MSDVTGPEGVAIIGMAGRFPGAADVDALWSNLCSGLEAVGPFSEEDVRAGGLDPTDPEFVNAGAAMDGIETFDAGFFGMSNREAELTDPQHRVVLETVWATLEHAGYDPGTYGGRIGLFGGVAENGYYQHNLLAHPELLAKAGFYPVLLATAREYAITRAAYKLGLRGPAVGVITACSTSAVGVHLAVLSLLAGDCDIALAGGAHIWTPARGGYVHQEGSILASDGHVRVFDAGARGTVMGSGVAFVALKRLADALADRDTVYAVIRGSAVNNDGAARMGFTAPGIDGQTAVVDDALTVADIDPATVGMVEAHGTGTLLGDPIEVAALTRAYRRHTDRRQYCAIGSLKSNIGHLDAAAGAAGIIKAALSLYHEQIPASINFRVPNPEIDFASSPFFVNTALRAWPRSEEPRRAGVSSFGFGGTNAHIILEEAPLPGPHEEPRSAAPHVLALSAKSAEALKLRKEQLAVHLASHPETSLSDAARTLAVGRSRMPFRSALVAADLPSAVGLLRRPDPRATAEQVTALTGLPVGFLFTGQGGSYAGMGESLYRTEPVFAEAMAASAQIVGEVDGHGLLEALYGTDSERRMANELLLRTSMAQPAIVALQVSLARLWASWGITPSAMVGHSVGELAAACIGGVFSLEDALRLAVARGRLMQDMPSGVMTAVFADARDVEPLLGDATSIAAVNAPEQCVVSGPAKEIDALERTLAEGDVPFRRLATDRAFHSPMMEPVLGALEEAVRGLRRGPLDIPLASGVTGAWVSGEDLADPRYWSRHARQPVRFAEAAGTVLDEHPDMVLVEVGPGATLTSLVQQNPRWVAGRVAVSSLPHSANGTGDAVHARRALGELWAAGADIDWATVNGGSGRLIPLPTYPFARERHWVEGWVAGASAPVAPVTAALSAPLPPRAAPRLAAERPEGPPPEARSRRIARQVTGILADLSGMDPASLDPATSFSDLGFDSLFLTQVNLQIRKQFGTRATVRQLLGELSTVETLAAWIDDTLDADALPVGVTPDGALPAGASPHDAADPWFPGAARLAGLPARATTPPLDLGGSQPDPVRWLVAEQLMLMEKQLDLMRAWVAAGGSTSAPATAPESPAVDGRATGLDTPQPPAILPVLPNVRRFLERGARHPEQWNLAVLLTPTRRLDPSRVRRVVTQLVERHDALRLRFSSDGEDWTSTLVAGDDPRVFANTDLAGVPADVQAAALEARAVEIQQGLSLETGPLVRVELFDLGPSGQRLLVVAHHFVMDQLSWPPFWDDFEALHEGLEAGVPSTLPAPVTTFRSWAEALQLYADSAALREAADMWQALPWDRVKRLPLDHEGTNSNDSAQELQLVLSELETERLLRRTKGVARKADLVLSALAAAIGTWTGSDVVLIDMLGHGRDDVIAEGEDPLAAVGFFISYTPLVLRLPQEGDGLLSGQIKPLLDHALDFDLLQYMSGDPSLRRRFRGLPKAQVLFNHHGQRDEPDELPHSALFQPASESIGSTHRPDGLRYYPIAVSSEVHRGQLRVNFVYSANLHEQATISLLADEFRRQLARIVAEAVPAQ